VSDPKATANTGTANRGIGGKFSDNDELIEVVGESELFASDPQYIDYRIQAVGWGLQLGASCLLFVGLDRPIFLPAAYINWSITDATADTRALYPSRESALASIAGKPGNWFAYYRTVGGIIAPTVFAPASTPRILTTLVNARKQLADEAKEIFTALAVSMIAGQLIRFGFGVLERVTAWTPKNVDWFTQRRQVPASPQVTRSTGSSQPNPAERVTAARGTARSQAGTATDEAAGTPATVGAAPTQAPAKTRSGKLAPLPGETPDQYYFRRHGMSISDEPPAAQNTYRRDTLREMQLAAVELALENPQTVWTHYLTKGGYQSIMRSQALKGGSGTTFGQGDGVRAAQGPFKNDAPIKMGTTHLDFQVPNPPVKGEATMYMGSTGAIWRTNAMPIKITRVGFVDGSFAQPLPSGKWSLTTVAGKKYSLDKDTLLQLGEAPSQGLRTGAK